SVVVDVTGTSGESACAFCRRVGKRALGSSAVRTRMWLANCCFAHISLGFPFLLRFCDEQPGHSFYPFYCYPGALARSWRRPFPRRGVASAQAPDPDLESLPETISEFTRVGPGPCWLDGALCASKPSAPFRNRSEAFDTASPS